MTKHEAVELLAPTVATLDAVLAAVRLAGVVEPPLVPRGQVGGCVECGHTVASHFAAQDDGTVRFLGCLKGNPETVYILVAAKGLPINGNGHQQHADGTEEPAGDGGTRAFRRARYFSNLHHKAKPSKVRIDGKPLSPTRLKLLEAIHEAGKQGAVYSELLKRTKLPHGSVQQTAHWLRETAHLVRAEADTTDE